MSPRSGPCSSAPFCTSGVGTSRVFWSYSRVGSKVLITLVTVECSRVRQIKRKEELRGCPATTEDYSNRTSYLRFGRYIAVFRPRSAGLKEALLRNGDFSPLWLLWRRLPGRIGSETTWPSRPARRRHRRLLDSIPGLRPLLCRRRWECRDRVVTAIALSAPASAR